MATAEETKTRQAQLNGAEIMIQALIHQQAKFVFAYPGGASMPLHQALRKFRDEIRTILPRHEQGGAFAAQGVSRTSDTVGVCMATSGPGATNLVTSIADAKLDSVPLIAITGQVTQNVIGSDAFQETPMVEVCRAITKHHYMITNINDVARIVKEAFHIATTGRPGPVLIDFPKDVQLDALPADEVDLDPPMNLPGYRPELPDVATEQINQIVAAIRRSKKPILYVGGGCILSGASEELKKFAEKAQIPVAMTVMGLGAFPGSHDLSLHMLGMHGTVYANKAIDEADLLLAFGVRFDDRVTGKLDEFAKHGKIVHVDIDPSEIHKNKEAHIPVVGDVKQVLHRLNETLSDSDIPETDAWHEKIKGWKEAYPLKYADYQSEIPQQHAIQTLWKMTRERNPYVAVGVGQHQMWTAQYFKFDEPRHWLSSSGLGTMGFGLPAAMGVAAAYPNELVIDIDGDGSFQMNIQELGTLVCENLPVKMMLLNNQHLGMVVQWEDRFMEGRRAHTYLGPVHKPEALGDGTGIVGDEIYPDFVTIAKGYGIAGQRVREKKDLEAAIQTMIDHEGPYLLEVICPYQEHVLPMIPSGKTVRDIITE
ncbi:biosynthetic-type acetolactate synthase large subunit [Rubinisphaera margarita]|uniref:biosynthetic-type acetolactate synthase large subunit n=1 Tax=Rubinisphaera margarita TaxID=2909586 RepID=UPI001EE8CA56|nr:biosynthetic-type acetolactate synthase large subunit [Rubinisphaera margarita]MCG6154975.1 biosynthetic-type acetolactate synthase large subunit [Rubinisphaera margarita]